MARIIDKFDSHLTFISKDAHNWYINKHTRLELPQKILYEDYISVHDLKVKILLNIKSPFKIKS